MTNISQSAISNMVQYLGHKDRYAVAGGKCCAATKINNGVWSYFGGPCYASPNFIKREYLYVEINRLLHLLDFDMHRVKGSGAFCGHAVYQDCEVILIDFAPQMKNCIIRRIEVINHSAAMKRVRVVAHIDPLRGTPSVIDGKYLMISTGIGTPIATWNEPTEVKDWCCRYAYIGFTDADTVTDGNLLSSQVDIKPDGSQVFNLLHYAFFTKWNADSLFDKDQASIDSDYRRFTTIWADWLRAGKHNAIKDNHLQLVCEGMLVMLKMCQSYDGGFTACPRVYPCSYLRDTHGALRGLAAAGYSSELMQFIHIIHTNYLRNHHIPNALITGLMYGEMNLNLSEEHLVSEGCAYYLLLCRYYLELTNDTKFLAKIIGSVRYAVDQQITYFNKNGGFLRFNGDETERYVPNIDGNMYAGMPIIEYMSELTEHPYTGSANDFIHEWAADNYSFASVTGMLASVQIFIRICEALGYKDEAVKYRNQYTALEQTMHRNFGRNDGTHYWTIFENGKRPTCDVVNYLLMSTWFGLQFYDHSELADIQKVLSYYNPNKGLAADRT